MDIYKLSRSFWDFAFENPDKIKPNHIALYFFAIEHCNRLGWKVKFGLPTTMVMEAIGVKSYNTYIKVFNELVEMGFFTLHEKSKNQYSSNVIELSKFNKANDKALDKALIKHATKQSESTIQSIDSIDIQDTSIQIYNSTNGTKDEIHNEVFIELKNSRIWIESMCMNYKVNPNEVIEHLRKFYWHCLSNDYFKSNSSTAKHHFNNWIRIGNPIPKIKESNFEGFE
jgi:hypothetical protein